jgi:hypothetical protein
MPVPEPTHNVIRYDCRLWSYTGKQGWTLHGPRQASWEYQDGDDRIWLHADGEIVRA